MQVDQITEFDYATQNNILIIVKTPVTRSDM